MPSPERGERNRLVIDVAFVVAVLAILAGLLWAIGRPAV